MIASILLPIAIEAGANILTGALRSKGGSAGSIAAEVIDVVAGKLGVEKTPEAIEARYQEDPGAVQGALLEYQAANLHALAEVIHADAEILRIQSEAQSRDIAAGGLNALWRPVVGVLFGINCTIATITVCFLAAAGELAAAAAGWAVVASFMATVFTTHAGVVGWYAHRRTDEKIAGVVG